MFIFQKWDKIAARSSCLFFGHYVLRVDKTQRPTFGLPPGWLDVVAISSSYQSAAVIGVTVLKLRFWYIQVPFINQVL